MAQAPGLSLMSSTHARPRCGSDGRESGGKAEPGMGTGSCNVSGERHRQGAVFANSPAGGDSSSRVISAQLVCTS
jgi:hypothetical protein